MTSWAPEDGTLLGPDLAGDLLVWKEGGVAVADQEDIRRATRYAFDYGPRSVAEFNLVKEVSSG